MLFLSIHQLFLSASFSTCFMSLGGGVVNVDVPFRAENPAIDCCPLQKEAALTKVESCQSL